MQVRKTLSAVAIAASAILLPAASQADTTLVVTPPGTTYVPDRVYEPTPAPREGYVWAPGYWSREGDRQVWIAGRWVVDRDDYVRRDRDREEHHWWRRHHGHYDDD